MSVTYKIAEDLISPLAIMLYLIIGLSVLASTLYGEFGSLIGGISFLLAM